jgi:glycosyltransferase involved in cell wall biosynthesis
MIDKIKIALVRGDSLNEWEGKLWENLGDSFEVTGFCGEKNLYPIKNLSYSVKHLPCSTDNFFVNNYDKYVEGIFQKMSGLEKELHKYDIVHTAEISYFFTTQAVRSKKLNPKLKVAATVWDNSFGRFEYNYWPSFKNPPAFWRNKMNAIIKENIGGVDIFLPITKYSAEMLLDYGANEKKIRILTPAVIMPEDKENGNILQKLNLSGQDFCMAVCRMVKEKGIYDILYAWRMYLKISGNSNKKLLFIGDGPEKDNLIRLAKELGLDGSVIFIGRLPNDEVRSLYKHAMCLILASLPGPLWQEQFGYVLAEAICSGCPVVSTYSGAIPEVVENAGLLFSPGNPVELRDCLKRLDDGNVCRELKNNCSKVKDKFAVEKFRTDLVKIYQELHG